MKSSRLIAAIALLMATPFSHAAVSSLGPVSVSFGVEGGYAWTPTPSFLDNLDGTFTSVGSNSTANWDCTWDMTVKPDPFIDAVFGMRNNTAVTQSYVISVSLPVSPAQIPFTKIGGSVGATLTDSNFSGSATLSDNGGPVYQGQNDGVTALSLFNVPLTVTVTTAGGSITQSENAGLPLLTINGPAAATSIGIVHRFKLSPGDSVAFTSFYIVEAVPEASTLVLVGMAMVGGIGAAAYRRRRQCD